MDTKINNRGMILIVVVMLLATIATICLAFLYNSAVQSRKINYDIDRAKALWVAEAGLQKAIWNLKTPQGDGGQGEDWTSTGLEENFGGGSYNMVVTEYDFASADDSQTSASSNSNIAFYAIDRDDLTSWQSQNTPTPPDDPPGSGNPAVTEDITVTFPYPIAINKVGFSSPIIEQTPQDYEWQISYDGVIYERIGDAVTGNDRQQVQYEFTIVSRVRSVRLSVTNVSGNNGVAISSLEVPGAKITSTGTAGEINMVITQTVVADSDTRTAAAQIDWNEEQL